MTDTDKLKRLAEAAIEAGCKDWHMVDYYDAAPPQVFIALIAENERLKREVEDRRKINGD